MVGVGEVIQVNAARLVASDAVVDGSEIHEVGTQGGQFLEATLAQTDAGDESDTHRDLLSTWVAA